MTPGDWLEELRQADLAGAPPPIDHARMLGRAHRMVRHRWVRVAVMVAGAAMVLAVAGAAVPTVHAREPSTGGPSETREVPEATPSSAPTDPDGERSPRPEPAPPPSQPAPSTPAGTPDDPLPDLISRQDGTFRDPARLRLGGSRTADGVPTSE